MIEYMTSEPGGAPNNLTLPLQRVLPRQEATWTRGQQWSLDVKWGCSLQGTRFQKWVSVDGYCRDQPRFSPPLLPLRCLLLTLFVCLSGTRLIRNRPCAGIRITPPPPGHRPGSRLWAWRLPLAPRDLLHHEGDPKRVLSASPHKHVQ